jgi:8-oxo-dGTP diphosphatase
MATDAFEGAKVALFLGQRLCTVLRDDIDRIPYPDMWDLPGGAREGMESPIACMQRESVEEIGLHVPETAILWRRAFGAGHEIKWFFIAQLPEARAEEIVFGDEGQRWTLMSAAEYLAHPMAIPPLKERLRIGLFTSGLEDRLLF